MRAAVLYRPHEPLQIEDVEVLEPQAGEVLVKVVASGVCGSDHHVYEGRSPVLNLPMVLGHEGAGIVERVGPGVTTVAPGDHVVVAMGGGACGKCLACRAGEVRRCTGPTQRVVMGVMPDGSSRLRKGDLELHPMVGVGSFAEYVVCLENSAIKVRADAPLETACLVGCGVTTGVGAALNTAQVQPGSSVAVVGCGGVGLNVVQGARLAGAARIIAVDTNPHKLELAASFGATHQVLAADQDVVAQVQAFVPGGVDYAFEVIGNPATVAQAFAMSRAGGTTIMVGSPPPGSQIAVDGRLLFAERKLIGCTAGSSRPVIDFPRIIDFYMEGRLKLDELVSQRRPLEEVNEAFRALERGEVAHTVLLLQ